MNSDPLIVALDLENAAEARTLVSKLGDHATFYKVGMELYAAAGMPFVHDLLDSGNRVFLDLKFYDIGETVRRATAQVAKSGATFLTVHGSSAVMQAAMEGRGDSSLKLLAVTVLTSWDERDLLDLGYPEGSLVSQQVALRVRKALESGIDGVVASALDAPAIRAVAGDRLVLVTPGVRSSGAPTGDQKRIATPAEALRDGADYLVIGRQVTRAADPVGSMEAIREEIAQSSAALGVS